MDYFRLWRLGFFPIHALSRLARFWPGMSPSYTSGLTSTLAMQCGSLNMEENKLISMFPFSSSLPRFVGANFPATTTASSSSSLLCGHRNSIMEMTPSTPPSVGSLGNASFKDIVLNSSSSFSHLV
jgi:hypothetical protein